MSWTIDSSKLGKGDSKQAWWTTTYKPGDGVRQEITSNDPDKFPPQNHHQHTLAQGDIRWRLNVRTNTKGI